MPVYEYRCPDCGSREEVFTRSVFQPADEPRCAAPGCPAHGEPMQRTVSTFARHLTEGDKLAEAEAKWGKEVDTAMGPEPDVGKYARRFDTVGKELPPA